MYEVHFLFPEQKWGVFKDKLFVCSFNLYEDAQNYCNAQQL